MKIRLELAHKNAKVKTVLLKADTVIGRSTECGLRIASNEVSRQHCKICLNADGVTVRDLGSSNGTFINGYQLDPDTEYEIAPDSELSLGDIKFFVRFTEAPAKMMQSDGMGSTVDLKPQRHPNSGEDDQDRPNAETEREKPGDRRPIETVQMSISGTMELARPRDPESVVDDEPDYEMSTHGDSAVLERNEQATKPPLASNQQPDDTPNREDDVILDTGGPEEEVVDLELDQPDETLDEVVDLELEEESESVDVPSTADYTGVEDVAAFLNQVGSDDELDDEEPMGDFFKQFD